MNTTPKKKRLDQLLVERELFSSRHQAQLAIRSGQIQVNNQLADKPGALFSRDCQIKIKEKSPYVSRGGKKLAAALKEFKLNATNKIALDIGSSTGGFTDCLLQHGAKRVYAIDVGYGQLALPLRNDPRVILKEKTNARYLKPGDFPEKIQLVTIDVSFISLDKILPVISKLTEPETTVIALIKPQFEAGRKDIKKGVIRDPEVHCAVIEKIKKLARDNQLETQAIIPSPILGPAGNKEFLIYLVKK